MATFDPIPLDGDPEGPTDLTSLMTEMDETLALGELPPLKLLTDICEHKDHSGFSSAHLAKFVNPTSIDNHFKGDVKRLQFVLECLVPSEVIKDNFFTTTLLHCLRNDLQTSARTKILSLPLLKWLNCLIQFSLCQTSNFQPLIDQLMYVMWKYSVLRPYICEILVAIITKSDINSCRIKALERIYRASKSVKNTKERKAIINLIDKFKYLHPKALPKNLSNLTRPGRSNRHYDINVVSDQMTSRFAKIWLDRNPVDTELDELAEDCRLTWNNDEVFDKSTDCYDFQGPKSKKQKLDQVLPIPEVNPLRPKANSKGLPLNRCVKVGDVFKNLRRLSLPAQTLSLLNNRGTFILLILNKNPNEIRTRLNLSLYSMLYNEFFGSVPDSKSHNRRRFILQRVSEMQDFFQEGIPVVGRFLSEFLSDWDGKEFFIQIMCLLAHIQITEYQELHECVLSPLIFHFTSTFNFAQRLFFLVYLHKLLSYWINLEFDRCCEPQENKRFFGVSNPDFESPLTSVSSLLNNWLRLAEMGWAKTYFSHQETGENKQIYLNEMLTMCLMVSRLLIKKDLPLCLEMPRSFAYSAMFWNSPIFMSRIAEHFTVRKHENIPICRRTNARIAKITEKLEEEEEYQMGSPTQSILKLSGRERVFLNEKVLIKEQLGNNNDKSNTVTKDYLAILSYNTMYLDRGLSLFRKHWEIDEEFVRSELKLQSHPVVINMTFQFCQKLTRSKNAASIQDVFHSLQNQRDDVYQMYLDYLNKYVPRVCEFLSTFSPSRESQKRLPSTSAYNPSYAQSQFSQKSFGASTATSGISSMQPTRATRRGGLRSQKKPAED